MSKRSFLTGPKSGSVSLLPRRAEGVAGDGAAWQLFILLHQRLGVFWLIRSRVWDLARAAADDPCFLLYDHLHSCSFCPVLHQSDIDSKRVSAATSAAIVVFLNCFYPKSDTISAARQDHCNKSATSPQGASSGTGGYKMRGLLHGPTPTG